MNDSQEQLPPTPEENNPIKEESPVATEPVDILPIPPVNDSQEQLPPTPEEKVSVSQEVQAIQDAPLPEIKGSGKKTKRRRNKRRLTKRRKTKRSKSNK